MEKSYRMRTWRKINELTKVTIAMVASSKNDLLLGFRIDDFDVDPLGGMLTPVNGKPCHLEPKVMNVLVHLANCSGQMVTRDSLLDLVWPGQVAADELLTRAVSELRRAFDDDAKHPKYIVTVPKRGYRLIGDVVPHKGAQQAKTDEITGAGYSTTARKQAYVAAGVVALVIAYFTIDRILIDSSQSAKSGLSETGSIGSALITAPTAARLRPLTSMEGFEREPALSPDGNYVAYTWLDRLITRHGVIYRQPVDGGTPNRLTDADESEHSPAWSPDGTRIAFIRETREGGRDIIVKPMLGGFEKRIATFDRLATELDWSTDGDFLAFQGAPEAGMAQGIYLLSLSSGRLRALTENREITSDVKPKFSPDGKSLAFLRLGGRIGGADICVQDFEQSEARCITPEDTDWIIQDIDWTPDSQEIVASVGGLSGLSSLRRISISTGIYTELTYGNGAMDISIARHGGRLVFEQLIKDHNLWRVAGPGATAFTEPSKLIASTWDDLSPEYSPDGTMLAFMSARSGSLEVWVANADGSQPRQLTNWGFAAFPNWSPDGKQIAFSTGLFEEARSDQSGAGQGFKINEAFVVDASGGIPRLVTENRHGAKNPSWSMDGRWIYFESNQKDCGFELWKRNVDTGEERQLARCAAGPLEGPDRRVYFIDVENESIGSVTADGDDLRTELDSPGGCGFFYYQGWTLWERNLVYIDCEDHIIKAMDLDTREIRELASVYTEDQVSPSVELDVSPDGKWMTYTRLDRAGSDLMLVEPFQ